MAGVLDKMWEGLKNVGKAAEKKKSKKYDVIKRTRGGQTSDASETMKELEKESTNDYASVDE